MAERPPTKKSREPTTELEVEPDSGEIELPPARPMGTRERKISVPPPPPPPPARKRVTTPVTPMPESATPEPSVLLGSDAITLEPDSGAAPLPEGRTQIVQPLPPPARVRERERDGWEREPREPRAA